MVNFGNNGTVMNPSSFLKSSSDPSSEQPVTQRVSDYLGFGSYSGADCKVVVHLPYDYNMRKELYSDKAYYEDQMQQMSNYDAICNSLPPTQETMSKKIMNQSYMDVVERKLSNIDSEINSLKNMSSTKVIAELQTISYSIYREKVPVRTLGSVYPRAYVRGPRTIGGSMIFTVFHQHVLHEILDLNLKFYNTGTSDHDNYRYTTNLPDQLPPLDISLIFANEYGAVSHMGLYGVEFVQEGTTYSIEDIFSENVVQYVARDMDPLRLVAKREVDGQGITEAWSTTASSLSGQKLYQNNHLLRRNQFI